MIDWERVETLRDDVGGESFNDVVALFLQEVDEVIDRLRQAPDLTVLEQDLHFLKGGALNLGFSGLGALCESGERRAASGHGAAVSLPEVVALYEQSRHVFLERLDRVAVAA